jgi:hypothetical protein
MEGPNLGPDWLWNIIIALAVAGFFVSIAAIVYGIFWLVKHIHMV